jgi:hypothetical protein
MRRQNYLQPPVWPLVAPPPQSLGEWSEPPGRLCLGPQRQQLAPQYSSATAPNSPSWADIVRNGMAANPLPPTAPAGTAASTASTTADFLALYNRCVSSGLKARINISNNAGLQEITLTCQLSAAVAITRGRRRRRTRRRGQANKAAAPSLPRARSSQPVPAVPSLTWPEPPPPEPPPPELSPPEPPPTPSPPPAKRTRKAAKRRCEAELLRCTGMDDDLCLSPPLFERPRCLPCRRHRLAPRRLQIMYLPCTDTHSGPQHRHVAPKIALRQRRLRAPSSHRRSRPFFLHVLSKLYAVIAFVTITMYVTNNVQPAIKKRGGTNYHGW